VKVFCRVAGRPNRLLTRHLSCHASTLTDYLALSHPLTDPLPLPLSPSHFGAVWLPLPDRLTLLVTVTLTSRLHLPLLRPHPRSLPQHLPITLHLRLPRLVPRLRSVLVLFLGLCRFRTLVLLLFRYLLYCHCGFL
jgi:hypothetical protein